MRCRAEKWPLEAMELLEPGEIRQVKRKGGVEVESLQSLQSLQDLQGLFLFLLVL